MNELKEIIKHLVCLNNSHSLNPIVLICFNETCQNRLLCSKCIVGNHDVDHTKNYILIDDLLSKTENSINNFPNDTVMKEVKDYLEKNVLSKSLELIRIKIKEFFDNLESVILCEVGKLRDEINKVYVQERIDDYNKMKDYYFQCFDELINQTKSYLSEINIRNNEHSSFLITDKINLYLKDSLGSAERKSKIQEITRIFENTKLNLKNEEIELNILDSNFKNFQNQLKNLISEFQDKKFITKNKFEFLFTKSRADDSSNIIEIEKGLTFQGSGKKKEIIYTDKPLSSGKHTITIRFPKIDKKNQHIFIGLVNDNEKDLNGYNRGFNHCIFCSSGYQLSMKNKEFFKATKGIVIFVYLDFEKNIFSVKNHDSSIEYDYIGKENLLGKTWRLYLFFYEGCKHKIEILETRSFIA